MDELFFQLAKTTSYEDARKLLELDLKFHDYLFELADHTLLKKTWYSLGVHIRRFLYLQPSIYDDLDKIAQTHEPIVSALEGGDSAKAKASIEQHIREVVKLHTTNEKN